MSDDCDDDDDLRCDVMSSSTVAGAAGVQSSLTPGDFFCMFHTGLALLQHYTWAKKSCWMIRSCNCKWPSLETIL